MSAFSNPRVRRRSLLAGLGGGAALVASGVSLSACSQNDAAQANTAANNEAVKLPTYVPFSGVTPDLPGTKQGVDPAYRHWPSDNPTAVDEKPGTGEESVTGMANISYAIPPGVDKNSYWAGLNDRLGVDLRLHMVPSNDYGQKFATTIAGSDLPDVMRTMVVANFPDLLDKRFQPLTDYLEGDAVKDYPNLANLPTESWKSTIYNGKIYGIPIPRGRMGGYNFIRADIFDAKGLSTDVKGYDQLIDTAKELTDEKKRRWAFATIAGANAFVGPMNGEPNAWRYESDKLTHNYETDEYKQTLTDLISIWKSGVVHPDAFNPAINAKQLFNSGTCAILPDGYLAWPQYISDNEDNPSFKLGLMPGYTRDGSELAHMACGSGVYSMTAFKKQSDPAKIKLILRILDWLAAPFGTKEYLYRVYGQAGVDHKMSADGDPTLTTTGATNTVLPIRYLADSPAVVYQPGRPQDADTQHKYQSLEIPTGVANPTVGLFSNTAATTNATIDTNFNDGVNQIIQGRKPISELDSLLSAWRSGGGDAMRKEYQEQLQANGAPS